MRKGFKGLWVAAMAGAALVPGTAVAQIATGAQPGQGAPASDPQTPPDPTEEDDTPIVSDRQFEASMPRVTGTIEDDLEPMAPDTAPAQEAAAELAEPIKPIGEEDAEFAQPLVPIENFEVTTRADTAPTTDSKTVTIRYTTEVEGLEELGLDGRFRELSALRQGGGKAANAAMVAARAMEDERLVVRLLHSVGYYDGRAVSNIVQNPENSGNLQAVITAIPGDLYKLGKITIDAPATEPAGMIEAALPLRTGEPIDAERVQGAEANVSLTLPQRGYPFAHVGQRDILLDPETFTGDYTLPVTTGPRSRFGGFRAAGEKQAFGLDHVEVLSRFDRGELYDSRKVDDLREALIATSLFSTVSVEPTQTGEKGEDGTEIVDLIVTQNAGKPRTIAGQAGYSTGQGLRVEGSWTHRNLFPPEGALILTGVAGTQEQGATATFRRSNAGKRDRTFQIAAALNHSDYEAFESYAGALSARISRDSTPIWQKRWTYYYGAEIVGSNEDRFNFDLGVRDRGTWLIVAAPTFLGFDTSDNLLNPTRGFRIKANVSPEFSVRGAWRPYARLMLEGTAYYPVNDSLVIAGRARAGSIVGIDRNDLPPSRRYYAGGGGSVRGFGYQELGPRAPDGKPVGGRGLSEFAIEARYRMGDFGIVPFVDAGNVSESIYPNVNDLRFGAGIGARYYTNFGPVRIDVATPIGRRPGESRVSLYISIGQAF